MSIRSRLTRMLFVLAALASFTAMQGCGSSEYNRLVGKRLGELRGEARFRSLFGPTTLSGTPVSIRVPQMFKNSYVEDSSHPIDGATIDPDRVQPPFLKLPGFKLCYETNLPDPERGSVPVYCYLGAVPGKAGDADLIAKDLHDKLKETFKDTPEFEVVDADTPTGKPVQWKKLRITADQPFKVLDLSTRKMVAQKLPAIFELWVCDKTDYVVLMAFRAPTSVEGAVPPPAADTPAALQPATPTKIDLSSVPALVAGSIAVSAPKASG